MEEQRKNSYDPNEDIVDRMWKLPLGDESAGAAPDLQDLPGYQDLDSLANRSTTDVYHLPEFKFVGDLSPYFQIVIYNIV